MTAKQFETILVEMNEYDFQRFLENLPDDEEMKNIITLRRATLRLFSDPEYYKNIKTAVQEMVVREFFA